MLRSTTAWVLIDPGTNNNPAGASGRMDGGVDKRQIRWYLREAMNARGARGQLLVISVALLVFVVAQVAFAGRGGESATTSSLKSQLSKVKKRLAALEAKPAPTSLPPSGAASGDLAGSYPSPT